MQEAQAALSSAVGPTMPQPTQHSLIHVLLLWTTILSIVQAVFIILFFTSGHRGPSQNSSAVAPLRIFQANITPPPSSDHGFPFGKMFSYKAKEVEGKLKWIAIDIENDLVSENGKDLVIKSDGYYYLNLQITLSRDKDKDKCPCNGRRGSECTVLLQSSEMNQTLLEGWINANTCSTGLLGKVMKLTAGTTLKFTIIMPRNTIIEEQFLTHLDIICMVKA